jgi:hypothetical protein
MVLPAGILPLRGVCDAATVMFHHAIATVYGETTQRNNKWDGRLHLS